MYPSGAMLLTNILAIVCHDTERSTTACQRFPNFCAQNVPRQHWCTKSQGNTETNWHPECFY